MPRSLFSFFVTLFYVAFALLLVVFSVANRAEIEVSFYPLPYLIKTPLFILAILLFSLGVIFGSLQAQRQIWQKRRELRYEKKRVAALENELSLLKTLPSSPGPAQPRSL